MAFQKDRFSRLSRFISLLLTIESYLMRFHLNHLCSL